jgi:hypothetical protein
MATLAQLDRQLGLTDLAHVVIGRYGNRDIRRVLVGHADPGVRGGCRSLPLVSESAEAYRAGLGFSGSAVVAQIRAAATDLLGTADLPHAQADALVRQAGGPPPRR